MERVIHAQARLLLQARDTLHGDKWAGLKRVCGVSERVQVCRLGVHRALGGGTDGCGGGC